MKFKGIAVLASCLFLVSCVTSNFNLPKNSQMEDIALLYTYTEGTLMGKTYNVVLDKINGDELAGKSSSYLYLKPGDYEITVKGYSFNSSAYMAGAIAGGAVGGVSGFNTGAAVAGSEAHENFDGIKSISVTLEAGGIYVIDPVVEGGQIKSVELKSF